MTYTPNADFFGTDTFKYTVTTANNSETTDVAVDVRSVIDAVIDVKPGGDPNSINLGSNGVLPIGVYTTSTADGEVDDFDASTLLTDTIKLNGIDVDPVHAALEDLDGDGDLDLILHFRTRDLVDGGILYEESVDLALTAEYDGGNALGNDLQGSDSVRVVPPKGKGKSGK